MSSSGGYQWKGHQEYMVRMCGILGLFGVSSGEVKVMALSRGIQGAGFTVQASKHRAELYGSKACGPVKIFTIRRLEALSVTGKLKEIWDYLKDNSAGATHMVANELGVNVHGAWYGQGREQLKEMNISCCGINVFFLLPALFHSPLTLSVLVCAAGRQRWRVADFTVLLVRDFGVAEVKPGVDPERYPMPGGILSVMRPEHTDTTVAGN
ncbi:hypothetical protein CBL_04168 [Carabus blaptoides fortunei]